MTGFSGLNNVMLIYGYMRPRSGKSCPINCQDDRIFRIEQHRVNHGYMRPRSGKSCPINCQDDRIFRIEQRHVNHGYMRPRSGKSCPINCQDDRIFRIEQRRVNHVLNLFQGFFRGGAARRANFCLPFPAPGHRSLPRTANARFRGSSCSRKGQATQNRLRF